MIVDTSTLTPGAMSEAVYNGLDCCITAEVFAELRSLSPLNEHIYKFELALQAPLLEIMLRGWKVDLTARHFALQKLRTQRETLSALLNRYGEAVWLKGINAQSPLQLKSLFYETMKLPLQYKYEKGQRKITTNIDAMEKLRPYYYAQPIVEAILKFREVAKKISVLESEVDPDGRMRTSYNITTETGRLSSSQSVTETGTNLQNITRELRHVFVADDGYKLCGIDLEQAESREVGWFCGTQFNDWSYLDACESGDLHTAVCQMIWPDLKWTGDPKKDKALAETNYYRQFTYRDIAKRGGHGSNYMGAPTNLAQRIKVRPDLMVEFSHKYMDAFPGIPLMHQHIAQEIQTTGKLTTAFGRTRHFLGRPGDDSTIREAVAYKFQSPTADRTNLGLWRVWRYMHGRVQILGQVHDAIYFLYPECSADTEQHIIADALEHVKVWLIHNGRRFTVPGEAKVGWNWGDYSPANPDGLRKLKGPDTRKRTPLMERIVPC